MEKAWVETLPQPPVDPGADHTLPRDVITDSGYLLGGAVELFEHVVIQHEIWL